MWFGWPLGETKFMKSNPSCQPPKNINQRTYYFIQLGHSKLGNRWVFRAGVIDSPKSTSGAIDRDFQSMSMVGPSSSGGKSSTMGDWLHKCQSQVPLRFSKGMLDWRGLDWTWNWCVGFNRWHKADITQLLCGMNKLFTADQLLSKPK